MEESKVINKYKLVIVGGSAGSLNALMQILPSLNALNAFALVIVLHRRSTDDMTLEELVKIKTITPVKLVEDKVKLEPGFIYVAPANYHLLFEADDRLALDISEKVNYSRPSIDVSFESAAQVYGSQLVGILLSGSNADGTEGLKYIQKLGGTIIVQDPKSADMPFMPNNAIANMTPDRILDIEGILDYITNINT
ncbi:chemotaxis protein CheB [Flavobacterium hercynium]|uniref:protein-glutamate methylesterase n=1 Tax=Flavobacterium hercynium TaxID=387094 RepID=A0A226HAP9_9FLAO|nr:chemotaxis protein CheB [Flavobacterium hercynium]OXA91255.1 chemotaxis protein CheB [Flavobacterium hercynium]SMP12426.1 CheB methylesterase [Flavobacterium hercynium]